MKEELQPDYQVAQTIKYELSNSNLLDLIQQVLWENGSLPPDEALSGKLSTWEMEKLTELAHQQIDRESVVKRIKEALWQASGDAAEHPATEQVLAQCRRRPADGAPTSIDELIDEFDQCWNTFWEDPQQIREGIGELMELTSTDADLQTTLSQSHPQANRERHDEFVMAAVIKMVYTHPNLTARYLDDAEFAQWLNRASLSVNRR